MKPEVWFWNNICKYLFNKNILEYALIARSGPKSMILDIESHSSISAMPNLETLLKLAASTKWCNMTNIPPSASHFLYCQYTLSEGGGAGVKANVGVSPRPPLGAANKVLTENILFLSKAIFDCWNMLKSTSFKTSILSYKTHLKKSIY